MHYQVSTCSSDLACAEQLGPAYFVEKINFLKLSSGIPSQVYVLLQLLACLNQVMAQVYWKEPKNWTVLYSRLQCHPEDHLLYVVQPDTKVEVRQSQGFPCFTWALRFYSTSVQEKIQNINWFPICYPISRWHSTNEISPPHQLTELNSSLDPCLVECLASGKRAALPCDSTSDDIEQKGFPVLHMALYLKANGKSEQPKRKDGGWARKLLLS